MKLKVRPTIQTIVLSSKPGANTAKLRIVRQWLNRICGIDVPITVKLRKKTNGESYAATSWMMNRSDQATMRLAIQRGMLAADDVRGGSIRKAMEELGLDPADSKSAATPQSKSK